MELSINEYLDNYFKTQEKVDEEAFNQIVLYIYYLNSQSCNSDLFILARLLPTEFLNKLIMYYDGDIIKMPSKQEFKRSFIVSVCFYLKEIKNWEWPEIKKFFPSNDEYNELISSISIGRQINNIKESLGNDLLKLLKNIKIDTLEKYKKEILNGKRNNKKSK